MGQQFIPSKPLIWDKLKFHWLIPNSERRNLRFQFTAGLSTFFFRSAGKQGIFRGILKVSYKKALYVIIYKNMTFRRDFFVILDWQPWSYTWSQRANKIWKVGATRKYTPLFKFLNLNMKTTTTKKEYDPGLY
jgi:hypothetical protein